jgi:hypothetical protein
VDFSYLHGSSIRTSPVPVRQWLTTSGHLDRSAGCLVRGLRTLHHRF